MFSTISLTHAVRIAIYEMAWAKYLLCQEDEFDI